MKEFRWEQGDAGPAAGAGGMLSGMRGWVKETIELYRGGMNSRRLLLQQAMGESEDGAQTPPTILTMQQYTRLVITTLEVHLLLFCAATSARLLLPAIYAPQEGQFLSPTGLGWCPAR
jgi:hypothetical protein